jgi:hypothetical protein
MNIRRLFSSLAALTVIGTISSQASADPVVRGFSFDHTQTPSLSSPANQQNTSGSRQSSEDVKQQLAAARKDGELSQLDSTIYFGQ